MERISQNPFKKVHKKFSNKFDPAYRNTMDSLFFLKF